jgi:hypothetical protein
MLSFTNPNKAWVMDELDRLISRWSEWNDFVQALEVSPDYNPQTCTEAVMDGFANLRKHDILRQKTLVFIANNFDGYDFILAKWPQPPHESNIDRLMHRVPVWLHRLQMLKESSDYAQVPDGFWKGKGKELVDAISSTPEKAVDIAASYLRNPLG